MSSAKGLIEIIANLMPPTEADEYRRRMEARDAKESELCESLRTNLVDAMEDITSSFRHPRISREYIEAAIAKLNVALDCAKALDE